MAPRLPSLRKVLYPRVYHLKSISLFLKIWLLLLLLHVCLLLSLPYRDTFDGFTYEEAQNSIDPLWKNTHRLSGVEQTQKNISEALQDNKTPYSLHVNNICRDMLPEGLGRVVVANVDVDMYEPTLTALYKISDHVVPGGIILCEDPPGTPALYGALLAMEEFLDSDKGKCYTKIFKGGQYFLVKRT